MNSQGNVMRAMLGGIMFIVGMLILLVVWGPLFATLAPYLDNAEVITLGPIMKLIIMFVPAMVAFTGIIILISEASGDGIR